MMRTLLLELPKLIEARWEPTRLHYRVEAAEYYQGKRYQYPIDMQQKFHDKNKIGNTN